MKLRIYLSYLKCPSSSILSASSSTKKSISGSLSLKPTMKSSFIISQSLPGVATMIGAFRLSTLSCFWIAIPPTTGATNRAFFSSRLYAPSRTAVISEAIWTASSRVGTMIRARGWLRNTSRASLKSEHYWRIESHSSTSLFRIGSPKHSVLPAPVLAEIMRSRRV